MRQAMKDAVTATLITLIVMGIVCIVIAQIWK